MAGDSDNVGAEQFVAEEPRAIEAVRSWVAAHVRSRWSFPDPESALQAVLLALLCLARSGRIRGATRFRAYVATVARHTCIDLHRRQRLGERVEGEASPGGNPAPNAESLIAERQKRETARYVVQSLPPACRELLGLIFGQGLGVRDAGERLGISEGNVRVRTHRCLEQARGLRRRFEERGEA